MDAKKQCALLPIIKDHVGPLMKLFRKELKDEYYMNDATKCLYTAVLVMALYMGKYSLSHIRKCDVDYVQKHYGQMRDEARKRNPDSEFDPSPIYAKSCAASMFSPIKSQRYLYYIMLTNADVPLKGNTTQGTILFPGHVCVVEKFPNNRYHLYQSYINQYDLNGHYEHNKGSFSVSKEVLMGIFDEIIRLYVDGTWTARTSKMWKQFTHVNADDFDGREFKGRSFFCYRKIPIKTCTSRILTTINKAMKSDLEQETKQQLDQLKTSLKRDFFSPEK